MNRERSETDVLVKKSGVGLKKYDCLTSVVLGGISWNSVYCFCRFPGGQARTTGVVESG